VTVSPAIERRLKRFLQDVASFAEDPPNGEESEELGRTAFDFIQRLWRKPAPAKRIEAVERHRESVAERRENHREETREIRAAVWKRSEGGCENCGIGLEDWEGELDHWLGGSGRRRQQQGTETTWRLCRPCHRARSANSPSYAAWKLRWAAHRRAILESQTEKT
jgi:5-methylcytosine-specific restriction endonuclease McrA